MRILFVLILMTFAMPATAQTLDCSDPQDQRSANLCAYQAWQHADEDLNLAYKIAVAMAKSLDKFVHPNDEKITIILRDAQRAWITFRDKACEVEASPYNNGSIKHLVKNGCLERLTRRRTEDLRLFGEAN